ncbi:variable surface protein Vir12-related [Plasmodium vivax]|uniref:Variable surface protein Vir12-related n=1 Tax=Plasmodium vivax (strain Salvador I) TaxID=126793 RepID=A5KCV9_PLAVS|nr:variable surface protein Vir12-related [Plasmodium vivax]EDL42811.1 variable surface protein Vir12-related [Plasmodium vivax]|eukprot:XP_001608554.1 variable surface protein Vir12-related [Plasmodium vivax Sal-1]
MVLSAKNNWEEKLPDLPSYQKYKQLDSVDIADYSKDHCKNLKNSDDQDRQLCNKILKNLSILKKEKGKEQKHGCYYFQHWLHDKLGKKYYNGNVKGNKYSVAEEILDIVADAVSTNSIDQACKGYAFGDKESWKKEKDLHDYFENFKQINCNETDKDKCEKYVDYVSYINKLYVDNIDNCCEEDDTDPFCNPSVKCADEYDPQKLLTILNRDLLSLGKKIEQGRAQAVRAEAGREKVAPEMVPLQKLVAAADPQKEVVAAAAPAAAKPVAVKPTPVVREQEVVEEAASENSALGPAVRETTGNLQSIATFSPSPIEGTREAVHASPYFTTDAASNAVTLAVADSTNTLGTTHEELDSNFFSNIIMGAAVLGTIFFLFYYNRSSRFKSSSRKKKRKKGKIFEHNYYEEYEKELPMYDSEETFIGSEADRLYLNYHPDQDSYY